MPLGRLENAGRVLAVPGVCQAHFGSDLRCDDAESLSTDRGTPPWKAWKTIIPGHPLLHLSPSWSLPAANIPLGYPWREQRTPLYRTTVFDASSYYEKKKEYMLLGIR